MVTFCSEGKLYTIRINFVTLCIHIETVNLSDGVYELVPAAEDAVAEGNLTLTDLNQDPDQRPEEPKANRDSAQKGKPRCIILFIFTRFYVHIFN